MKPVFKTCELCGKAYQRRGPFSRFCRPCAEVRDTQRKSDWATAHPVPYDPVKQRRVRSSLRRALRTVGPGRANQSNLVEIISGQALDLAWCCWVRLPFSWELSKNAVWKVGRGRVYMKPAVVQMRDAVTNKVREAVARHHIQAVPGKVWLDIHVQKPNHRGDAVNFLDFVCDAVKVGLGVDDRWFAVRRIDWEVAKRDPRITIGFGQETTEPHRICSVCGHALPISAFKAKSGRECKQCHADARRLLREDKARPRLEVTVEPRP